MTISYEEAEMLLCDERFYPIFTTEKELQKAKETLEYIFDRYLLWEEYELDEAIQFLETEYQNRYNFLYKNHRGIYLRMKQHTDIKPPSYGERLVIKALKQNNIEFKAECYLGDKNSIIQSIRFDFCAWYNNELYVIEYNGKQHYQSCEKFGGDTEFKKQLKKDKNKRIFCKENNIPMLEIPYTVHTIEEVSRVIVDFLTEENKK